MSESVYFGEESEYFGEFEGFGGGAYFYVVMIVDDFCPIRKEQDHGLPPVNNLDGEVGCIQDKCLHHKEPPQLLLYP